MQQLVAEYWPLVFGLIVLGRLVFETWKERRTRNWPTTNATQLNIAPDSRFEETARGWRWRSSNETDCAISYVVNNQEYVTKIEELASISGSGGPISRTTGLPPSFEVRYRPENPEKIYYRHAYSSFTKIALILFNLAISFGLIGYFIYARFSIS